MNVILMVVDTLRADRLGCYGYFRDTSPTIDRLASEGALFEDYYASGISTGNAFTCIHTGLPTIRHRFYATPAGAPNLMNFDDAIPTLAEIVQTNGGHTTVALDNLMNFGGHMKQTVRGYEYYINPTGEAGFPHPEYTAGDVNARFLPWLESHSGGDFFAFLHFWDPHHNPYRAPGYRDRFKQPHGSLDGLPVEKAPAGYDYVPGWGRVDDMVWGMRLERAYAGRQVDGGLGSVGDDGGEPDLTQDLYDCSIAYLDSQIARILDVLEKQNALDQTLIVITADHGEGLGNHGIWGHGLPYDDTIHLPLIMWRPGVVPEGARVKGYAQHMDIAPTILDLLGIMGHDKPAKLSLGSHERGRAIADGQVVKMAGRSLLDHINGRDQGPDYIVMEVRRGPHDPGLRALIQGRWKLIESLAGQLELYNRHDDPMEKINLAAEDSSRAKEMSRMLNKWVRSHLEEDEPDPMRIYEAMGLA